MQGCRVEVLILQPLDDLAHRVVGICNTKIVSDEQHCNVVASRIPALWLFLALQCIRRLAVFVEPRQDVQ
ncbi:hypothetical protein D9M71_674210 [compost metagenome]